MWRTDAVSSAREESCTDGDPAKGGSVCGDE